MTTTAFPHELPETDLGFRHDAMFYSGDDDFVHRSSAFIRDGLAADEPILVVVSARKIELLRSVLGPDAADVRFADMEQVGRNPGRIIPAWHEFTDDTTSIGRPLRGISEPIFGRRSPAELTECERHEQLLNLAFAEAPAFWLVCPYDRASLPEAVLDDALRNHHASDHGGTREVNADYRGLAAFAVPFDSPLPEPAVATEDLTITIDRLDTLRHVVAVRAAAYGLSPTRSEDLVLCVNEVATNTVRHGGGQGVLRMWQADEGLSCEIRDPGTIRDPLAGRQRPTTGQDNGYGLWLVNQLCDLVQVRNLPTGTVVRMQMR